jgi:hypothetical protein
VKVGVRRLPTRPSVTSTHDSTGLTTSEREELARLRKEDRELRKPPRAASTRRFTWTSDLTNSPDDIPKFVARMDEGADVIKATRYSGGGYMRGVPAKRALMSALANRVAFAVPSAAARLHQRVPRGTRRDPASNGAHRAPLSRHHGLTRASFCELTRKFRSC